MKDIKSAQCLEFFSDLLSVLTTHRHYERVFHFVVDRIVRLYHCRACAIVLIDRETEYLRIENCYGISRTFCKEFRQKVATGSIGELLWTGRPILISDATLLPEIARSVELEAPFASCICVQIAVHHRTIGYLYADSDLRDTFTDNDIPVLQAFAGIAALAYYQNRLYEENLRLDRVDHETELQRYSLFSEHLQQNVDRARSGGEPLGLIMMDIDNYKRIANTYGGEARKAFLREFGGLLQRQLRTYDSACRYGADELVVMLPHTGVDETLRFAQTVCDAIRSHTFTEFDLVTTVSCGVVVFPQDADSVEEIMQRAKHSVFEAQRAGRNKIFHNEKEAQLAQTD
ncbi:MAG: sensor domain-containing diguanylate cyclase [Bacteroidota bacterium]|nr:sensor domain-containing diguanylate cyclase [Bacteroidota bacterium]